MAISKIGLTGITSNTGDPTTSSNPGEVGALWINSTSGEVYICTDATAGSNEWTNIGGGSGNISPTYSIEYVVQAGGGGGGLVLLREHSRELGGHDSDCERRGQVPAF